MSAALSSHTICRSRGRPDIELQRGLRVFDHDVGPHFHEAYQFVLIEDGNRSFHYRHAHEIAGTGVLTTVLPGELHSGSCSTEVGSSFRTLHLPLHYLRELDPALERRIENVPFAVRDDETSAAFQMLHAQLTGDGDPADLDEALLRFVNRLTRFAVGRAFRIQGKSGLRRAREFIHDHFRERCSLDEMAAVGCLSKFHFVREFTRVFGASPLAYRKALRMIEARRLLSLGYPVKAVALDLGFADQSHFGRAFRQNVGFTPAAYQRAVRPGPRSIGATIASPTKRGFVDLELLSPGG